MRVLIVNGQNHKGSTYHIGRMIADNLTTENEINEVFLPRDFSDFCCGCTKCFMSDEKLCPHYERLNPITRLIDKADVLIFTSPVYVYHATGAMKALLDHYGYRWMVHRPEEKMFSKQAVVVSTAAGGGMKSTNKDMKDSLSFWGVPKIYSIGTAIRAVSWDKVKPEMKEKLDRKTKRIANKIKHSTIKTRVSLKGYLFFTIMSFANRSGWNKADSEYWKSKGWTTNKKPWKK